MKQMKFVILTILALALARGGTSQSIGQGSGQKKGDPKKEEVNVNVAQKIVICHYPPGGGTPQKLEIPASAWAAHQAHGDVKGECPPEKQQAPAEKMITICHYPPGQPNNPQEISIPESAWAVHQAHGDTKGACTSATSNEQEMITICHYPPGQPNNPQEISIPKSAWSVHQAHGDVMGSCSGANSATKMITICHYPPGQPNNPQEISIPESAWAVHQAHGDVLGTCGNANSTPPPAKTGCDMAAPDFGKLKSSVKAKTFSADMISTLKVGIKNKCVTTEQVKELLGLFSFESDKLEMAKYLYSFTSDKDNYYTVGDVFTFSSSVSELNEFLEDQ